MTNGEEWRHGNDGKTAYSLKLTAYNNDKLPTTGLLRFARNDKLQRLMHGGMDAWERQRQWIATAISRLAMTNAYYN